MQWDHRGERQRKAGLMVTFLLLCKGGTGVLKYYSHTCERNVQISQEIGEGMEDIPITHFEDDFACLRQVVVNVVNTKVRVSLLYEIAALTGM